MVITKETIQRLIRDVKDITKNPLKENGIYYMHDEEDMLKGYAMIVGPTETPYFGGYYFFEIKYPMDYPHSPPNIKFCTHDGKDNVRFNPNLYVNGKVCVSLLNTWRGEQWTSCQTISTVLLTLCTLLCKDPLLNEPGITTNHMDFEKYTKIIHYKNIEIAHMYMIQKKEDYFPKKFDIFYEAMEEQFKKNHTLILKDLEEEKKKANEKEKVITGMYSMNITLDYKQLYILYKEECTKRESESKL
jgi:ubiquitin-conjugating enzyme E2 Z